MWGWNPGLLLYPGSWTNCVLTPAEFPKLGCLFHSSPTKLDCGRLALHLSHTSLGEISWPNQNSGFQTKVWFHPFHIRLDWAKGLFFQLGYFHPPGWSMWSPNVQGRPSVLETIQGNGFQAFIFSSVRLFKGNLVQNSKCPWEKSKTILEETEVESHALSSPQTQKPIPA